MNQISLQFRFFGNFTKHQVLVEMFADKKGKFAAIPVDLECGRPNILKNGERRQKFVVRKDNPQT